MRARVVLSVVLMAALVGAGCSSDDDDSGVLLTSTSTTRAPQEVEVTAATLEGPISTGEFNGPADPRPPDLDAIGYVQEEYFASGTATSYTAKGEPATNGRWTVTPGDEAPYKTRFVIRRPKDADDFNGTVVVEWLNVTVVEAAPDWAYTGEAIIDAGAAWVGVSVQALSIMGGQSLLQSGSGQATASGGLRSNNPTRYGTLTHPGDRFAFDIYSQIGAALRSPGDAPVLGDGEAARIIAAGESQSAGFLTGYINGFHKVAKAYDGYFVHSRGASAALPDGSRAVSGGGEAFQIRTDIDAPVMVFETETDLGPLLAYGRVQQKDSAHLRVWEVAGTAHADAYLVGRNFAACPYPINNGPQHYVATAALAATMHWVEDGTAPPRADRIEMNADGSEIVRDEHGLAKGGIRTPSVDAPVATLSGAGDPGVPVLCALFGKTTPFDAATVRSLYPTRDDYIAAFDKALDAAITKGFVRRADRAEYATEARTFDFPT